MFQSSPHLKSFRNFPINQPNGVSVNSVLHRLLTRFEALFSQDKKLMKFPSRQLQGTVLKIKKLRLSDLTFNLGFTFALF